jgi:hypothetical protein
LRFLLTPEKDHELQELRKPLEIGEEPDDFAKRNRGRLVATFLLSFVDENSLPAHEPSPGFQSPVPAIPGS